MDRSRIVLLVHHCRQILTICRCSVSVGTQGRTRYNSRRNSLGRSSNVREPQKGQDSNGHVARSSSAARGADPYSRIGHQSPDDNTGSGRIDPGKRPLGFQGRGSGNVHNCYSGRDRPLGRWPTVEDFRSSRIMIIWL